MLIEKKSAFDFFFIYYSSGRTQHEFDQLQLFFFCPSKNQDSSIVSQLALSDFFLDFQLTQKAKTRFYLQKKAQPIFFFFPFSSF